MRLLILMIALMFNLSCRERSATASDANSTLTSSAPCIAEMKKALKDHYMKIHGSEWNERDWSAAEQVLPRHQYTHYQQDIRLFEIQSQYLGGTGVDLLMVNVAKNCRVVGITNVYAE
jgi:hypothetical protein